MPEEESPDEPEWQGSEDAADIYDKTIGTTVTVSEEPLIVQEGER